MSIGAFPGIQSSRRRTVRSPENPLDKSTIVSIYPRDIVEVKPTIQPGRFVIPKGSIDNPSILVVGSSSWWIDRGEEEPLLEIPNNSIQIAESVVNDYCRGLLGCDMKEAMPGLFWVPGEYTLVQLRAKHGKMFERAVRRQNTYFEVLVKMTDSLWARTNGNPLVVSDDARLAAQYLGIQEQKDWMKSFKFVDQVRCVACGSLRNPDYPVCPTCKAVDKAVAEKLGITFAQ